MGEDGDRFSSLGALEFYDLMSELETIYKCAREDGATLVFGRCVNCPIGSTPAIDFDR